MKDDPLLGARVRDRHQDDGDVGLVSMPGCPCTEWDVDGEHSVADFPGNEEYPDDAPVVVVVFEGALDEARFGDYSSEEPIPLADIAEQERRYYAFPTPRLEVLPEKVGADA